MILGITGHQDLGDAAATAWVRGVLDRLVGEHLDGLVGVSNLAAGADQMFAELVVERQGRLQVVLPFADYRSRLGPPDARERYDRLLPGADVAVVETLPPTAQSEEQAYLQAGQEVVSRCELLLAVWDGAPSRGLGGTADVVANARERGRAMVIIDPIRRTVARSGRGAQAPCVDVLTDEALDAARRIGDPLVDPIVAEYVAATGRQGLGSAMHALFETAGLPDHPLVNRYLAALGDVDLGDADVIAKGQSLFALFGPEMFLILGSCSLPLALAAGNGVQVIHRARRLEDEPVRRLYDTAQMIINVMQEGSLSPGGLGWRTARKVRLMHALIRSHVRTLKDRPWSDGWGTPINQEDLAGTLLSFSAAVLHGLRRMGAEIDAHQADSFVYAWSAIGRLLGLDEALLAATEASAMRLAWRIGKRQIRATPEGKFLAEQLMGAVSTLFPIPGYANSLTHFFLADTAFGEDVAEILGLRPPGWTRLLVAARAWQKRQVLKLLPLVPGAERRRSFIARRFVQAMIDLRHPAATRPFEVPPSLAERWTLRAPPRSAT